MYHVAILEPSEAHVQTLVSLIDTYTAEAFEVTHFACAEALGAHLDEGGLVDILITNVALTDPEPGTSVPTDGIDFVQQRFASGTSVPTQVIYATDHIECATQVYRTPHVYFLVYPIAPQDFEDALDRACANLRAASNRPLAIRSDGRVQVVHPRKISYIESDRRKLHIHVGSDVVTTYATLDSVARNLPSSFVRSHKSFLVNMSFIESIDATHVTLFSGEVVPVSQKRRKATHKAFDDYMSNLL